MSNGVNPARPHGLHRLGAWLLFLALPAQADLVATIERVKPAVVGVATFQKTRNPPTNLLGTGFAVGDGSHVVTNHHVVPAVVDIEHRETLVVLVGTGAAAQAREATAIAFDKEHDLALLKIGGAPLPALTLGNSDEVREGRVLAFTGFPIGVVLGVFPVTHRGMVSSITPIAIPGRSMRQLDARMIKRLSAPYVVFQLDGTAYPGNSGSPLYDPETGTVLGIINMTFVKSTKESALSSPSGISYAIPAVHIRDLLKENRALP